MKKLKTKYKKGQFVIVTGPWNVDNIYEYSRMTNEQGSRVMKIKSFMLPCDHFENTVWDYKRDVRPATEQDLLKYLSQWLKSGIYSNKQSQFDQYMRGI